MKTRYFLPLAAIVLLAGCNKEVAIEEVPQPEAAKTVLEVSIGPSTKTTLGAKENGEYKVYWSNGDQIAVNGTASDALENLPDNTQSASFTINGTPETPYNILYPASIYKDASHVTLPSVQAYKADGFGEGMFPMAGYSADGSNITLSHLCAIVKIQVKRAVGGDEENIASVRFKGRNGEQVSGEFEINYSTPALAPAAGTGAGLEVRVVKNLATSTTDAVVYFLVVPAREYTNGFDIIVQDASGHIMTKSKTSSWTPAAGKLYVMPEFDFVPTGTELGVEIASAADLVKFATDYNNKVYDGLGSTLIATVTQDITFDATSSAAFNATGGIGLKINYFGDAQDMYFDGTFNGGGHTISGLVATTPIFKATAQSGQVNDLVLDNTCSFTFTHSNIAEMYACSIVGYHRGLIDNVSSAADITLAGGDVTKGTALGGLVGRAVTGEVKDCVYSGNITVPDTYAVDNQKTYVGGLVGYISNPDGKVTDSDFEGTIDFAGTVASTDTKNPYLFIGGIIGSNAGTVSGCEVKATKTKEITMDNNKSYVATIQNHSRKVYHLAQGGIAGQNSLTVSNCTNAASISNFVLTTVTNGGAASNDNSRYYDLGGIVGLNLAAGTVSGCINDGAIESRATPRIQKIGGVIGYNLGTVSSCSNGVAGSIYLTTTNIAPYNLRVGEVGGAIGNNAGTISDIQNAGEVKLDRSENAAGVELKFGGVIGLSTTAIDGGSGKNISNSGNILDTYNGTTVTTDGLRFGGIVGSAQASVKNVVNSGNVTFELSSANVMNKLYMGGVVGEVANTANVEISDCENSGEVYFNVNGKNAGHTGDYVGGIVGYIHADDELSATVSNNENSGYVHIACTSTTASSDLIVGGIIGKMEESGAVSNCNNVGGNGNAGEVAFTFSNAAHTDNYAGGIIGKAAGVNLAITECDNSGYVHGGNSSKQNGKTFFLGGIIAYLDGVSSISYCENTGKLLNDQFNNTITKVGSTFNGGIAGFVLGTASERITISNVTNDYDNGGTTTGGRRGYTGGAVGYGEYVDINNATNTNSYGGGSGYYFGGIAGWLVNSTVSNSTYSGTSIESSQVQGAGGIVCTLDAGSTIDGCNSYLSLITHGANACVDGDIAGKSVSGSTIKNCHYTGTYGLCSDANFTDGGGNVADL